MTCDRIALPFALAALAASDSHLALKRLYVGSSIIDSFSLSSSQDFFFSIIAFFTRVFQLDKTLLILRRAHLFTLFPLRFVLLYGSGNLYRPCNLLRRS